MKKRPLGTLETVNLREYWKYEDTDFTPWLAEEENISHLGHSLQMDLEVQEQEASVGPFRADILCRNLDDESIVLIENQLERTDHTHLGQILTYAAGLDAVTTIWIAERFTEEHRAALDWFNEITQDEFRFFGVEVELLRIGDSHPAPRFNVVSKPNNWSKTAREVARTSGATPETQEFRLTFWSGFIELMKSRGTSLRIPDPKPEYHLAYPMGRSGFRLATLISRRDGYVAVHFDVFGRSKEAHYRLLESQRSEIQDELGIPILWREGGDGIKWRLWAKQDANTEDREKWPTLQSWLLDTLNAFDRVLRPRIKALDAEEWQPEEENN